MIFSLDFVFSKDSAVRIIRTGKSINRSSISNFLSFDIHHSLFDIRYSKYLIVPQVNFALIFLFG